MNKLVINFFVLAFWVSISLSAVWGVEKSGKIEQTMKVNLSQCSKLFNDLQVKEVKTKKFRFVGADYREEWNRF